jgi:regulator of replication initiation timing
VLVRAQDHRPKIADQLQADNDRLRQKLADLRADHTRLKDHLARFARVIHVLEVENAQLRKQSQPERTIRPLTQRPCK